jgi:hypothetical protein
MAVSASVQARVFRLTTAVATRAVFGLRRRFAVWIVAGLAVFFTMRAHRLDVTAIFVVTAHAVPRRDVRVAGVAVTIGASGRRVGRRRIVVMER